jgi:hypothetical protein
MDFDYVALLFFALLAAIAGSFVYRLVRHGGLRGAMFGARVAQTIGVLELGRRGITRLRLKVHRLEAADSGDPGVAIEVVSTSMAGAGMVPIVLTKEQARTLAALLKDAAGA